MILSTIQTENPLVIIDVFRASQQLPSSMAEELVPVLEQHLSGLNNTIVANEASQLCVKLAKDGKTEAALSLADPLFQPVVDESTGRRRGPSGQDCVEYLQEIAPALSEHAATSFAKRLCQWLKLWIEVERRTDDLDSDDFSHIWRPAIEDHPENRDYETAGVIVGILRDCLVKAIEGDTVSLQEALGILAEYQYLIYKRLHIHLVNVFADSDQAIAKQTMLNKELFDNYRYKHEYAMLVGSRFELLNPDEQSKWFSWVAGGPDLTRFHERFVEWNEREPTDVDRANRIEHWQLEKLHWVRDHLIGDRKAEYDRLVEDYGEPELADLNVRFSSGWAGERDRSPFTVDELTAMSFEAAVATVSEWQLSDKSFESPTIEGLATVFGQYLETDPEQFSKKAVLLKDRPPTFVHCFVKQMLTSAGSGRDIDVSAVLDLSEWILDQPMAAGEEELDEDGDPGVGWGWIRDEVSRFVEEVCKADSRNVPRYPVDALREHIWAVIERLREVADPDEGSGITPDADKLDPRMRDYLDVAINCSRGKAFQAAIEYARWVALHLVADLEDKDNVPGGLDSIAEAKALLEDAIKPDNRSVAVMAIIGSRINLLSWIDTHWLNEHANEIFDMAGLDRQPEDVTGWAAWNAFIDWVRPRGAYYELLGEQYECAVEHTVGVELPEKVYSHPLQRLAEHLMCLTGWGVLDPETDDSLVRRFLQTTHPKIRRFALSFVGQWLRGAEKLPDGMVDRYQKLWDVYWPEFGEEDAKAATNEHLFGNWVWCGHFPRGWVLERLDQFTEVKPDVRPDHGVIKELGKVARMKLGKDHTERLVRILSRIVKGDKEGWHVRSWVEQARLILDLGMRAGGPARETSESVIDTLGRRGYLEFGELLKNDPAE
ncbi:MAG: hypothetical protein D8M59_06720 [Planctomycetes bacterium]|nr:hypothetical protein [Planctomycetota bacterium]